MKFPGVRGPLRSIVLCLLAPLCQADGQVGGAVGIASDEVLRGLTQSDHQLSWQGDLHYAWTGWYGGMTAYGVRRGASDAAGVGLTIYGGYERQLTEDWRGGVALRHYDYPGFSRRNNYDYDEAVLTLNWRQRVLASVIASPDVYALDYYGRYGRGAALTYELGGRQPLPWWELNINSGAGYYDLQHQVGTGYVYWSGGLSKQWRSLHVDLRYIGTSEEARRHFHDLAENRMIFSALWIF